MALATTCTKCNTSFRVAPDQLALRRGMVRCGVCQNVFSGMANLRHVDEILRQRGAAEAAAEQALPPAAAIKPLVKPAGSGDQKSRNAPNTFAQTDLRTAFFLPETVFGPTTEMVAEGESFLSEPAAVPRSIQPQPGQSSASGSATASDSARASASASTTAAADASLAAKDDAASIALRQPGPDTRIRWAQEAAQVSANTQAPSSETAPATVSSDRRKRGSRRRSSQERDRSDEAIAYFEPEASVGGYNSRSQAFGWLFCVFAAVLLATQLVIGARNSLSSNFPALRTPLQWLASPLGLTVEAPLDLHALTIESFELQAGDSPGLLTLSALLRNRASRATQWPALEIVLTDGQGTLLVRKVLLPKDYFAGLPAAATRQVESGIGARAELPLKLSLEARDLAASGYSVTLFYP
jgi:predicted Zn finger-like uncharacterized protein